MTLRKRATELTIESLNGGGWNRQRPDAHTSDTTAEDTANQLAGRRRMRELVAAWDDVDDSETEAS